MTAQHALMRDLICCLANARDGAGNPIFYGDTESGIEAALDIALNTPQDLQERIIQAATLMTAFLHTWEGDNFVGGWVTDTSPREQIHEAIRTASQMNTASNVRLMGVA